MGEVWMALDCDTCVRVLLGALIGNGGFMGCGFTVCVFYLVVVVGCLRGREREKNSKKRIKNHI